MKMNDNDFETLKAITFKEKNIAVNYDYLNKLYYYAYNTNIYSILDIVTDKHLLKIGFVVSLFGCNIWINKDIPNGYIKFFEVNDYPIDNKDHGWSPNILIDEYFIYRDKINKLKAFI